MAAVLYVAIAAFLFVQYRYWLPIVLPVLGALLINHVSLVTYRVVFEQKERWRVKSVFTRIVSPDVVNELLNAETISLGGARRDVTVLFADVRDFTKFTEANQASAQEFVTRLTAYLDDHVAPATRRNRESSFRCAYCRYRSKCRAKPPELDAQPCPM
jgi:adenylate cyclase